MILILFMPDQIKQVGCTWHTWSNDTYIPKLDVLKYNKSQRLNCMGGNYGCTKQYRHELDVYLIKMVPLTLKIIIDGAIGALGHGKYGVYGLNAIDMSYFRKNE